MIERIEVSRLRFDAESKLHEADLYLVGLRDEGSVTARTHLQCISRLPHGADRDSLIADLVRDARRQIRLMPEYRIPKATAAYCVEG